MGHIVAEVQHWVSAGIMGPYSWMVDMLNVLLYGDDAVTKKVGEGFAKEMMEGNAALPKEQSTAFTAEDREKKERGLRKNALSDLCLAQCELFVAEGSAVADGCDARCFGVSGERYLTDAGRALVLGHNPQ